MPRRSTSSTKSSSAREITESSFHCAVCSVFSTCWAKRSTLASGSSGSGTPNASYVFQLTPKACSIFFLRPPTWTVKPPTCCQSLVTRFIREMLTSMMCGSSSLLRITVHFNPVMKSKRSHHMYSGSASLHVGQRSSKPNSASTGPGAIESMCRSMFTLGSSGSAASTDSSTSSSGAAAGLSKKPRTSSSSLTGIVSSVGSIQFWGVPKAARLVTVAWGAAALTSTRQTREPMTFSQCSRLRCL